MAKFRIIALGKSREPWVTQGAEHYLKLLQRFVSVEVIIVPSPRLSASFSVEEIKKKESALLQRKRSSGRCVALSETGTKHSSVSFARLVESLLASDGALDFLIGGPHGLDDQTLADADLVLSLSDLTLPHQMARLVLLEQLYRAFAILKNTGYHK